MTRFKRQKRRVVNCIVIDCKICSMDISPKVKMKMVSFLNVLKTAFKVNKIVFSIHIASVFHC